MHQMLQKCMLTVDHSQFQYLLDHLGEGYDQAVLECQDQLADGLKLKQVAICLICYPIKLIFTPFHPLMICSNVVLSNQN